MNPQLALVKLGNIYLVFLGCAWMVTKLVDKKCHDFQTFLASKPESHRPFKQSIPLAMVKILQKFFNMDPV